MVRRTLAVTVALLVAATAYGQDLKVGMQAPALNNAKFLQGSEVGIETFRVRSGEIISIERSDVAAVSDAVLVRLAKTVEPELFRTACVDTSGRWYRPNGVTYNAECGRLLASISPDTGWFPAREAGLWLLSGGP